MAKAQEIDFEAPSSHKWVSTGGKPGRIIGAEQGEIFRMDCSRLCLVSPFCLYFRGSRRPHLL